MYDYLTNLILHAGFVKKSYLARGYLLVRRLVRNFGDREKSRAFRLKKIKSVNYEIHGGHRTFFVRKSNIFPFVLESKTFFLITLKLQRQKDHEFDMPVASDALATIIGRTMYLARP